MKKDLKKQKFADAKAAASGIKFIHQIFHTLKFPAKMLKAVLRNNKKHKY